MGCGDRGIGGEGGRQMLGRGLGPSVRPGSSLLCPNCPCGLDSVLLPSGCQFPYRTAPHSELVGKLG